MKKILAFALCGLMLSCFALAEDTVEPEALWTRLTAYRAELEEEKDSLNAEIKSLQGNIDYVKAVLAAVQSQMDSLLAEQQELTREITAADQLLAQTPSQDAAEQVLALLPAPNLTGKHYVQIDIANYGSIVAELDADAAPITVTNFINLVNEGFYNGLTFHRIISGFMIQGGDPNGNGTGGSEEEIKGEFSQNGWENPIKHERGVLSMARSSLPNSASSQFFIMHEAATHLDGAYAAFGRVLTGMDVVDAICANTPVTDSNGTVAAANQPVITAITVIEKPE